MKTKPKTLSPLNPACDGLLVCATAQALSVMKIKLYLEDKSGIATEVPIKDLVDVKKGSPQTCDSFSMEKLRYHAMRALFSIYIARDPCFQIPDYAVQYFETTFSYKQESDLIPINDNESLMKAIQYGSEHYICDDNDNIILDCYCKVKNTYISDVDKQLNQMIVSSTRVVDKTMRRLKNLMTKFRQNSSWYNKESSEGLSRNFVDRIFQFLDRSRMSASTTHENHQKSNQPKVKVASSLVGKISATAGKIATFFHHMNQTISDDNYSVSADSISLSVFEKIHKSFSYSSSSSSSSFEKSKSSHSSKLLKLRKCPQAIEIVFDCEDQRTPAEWNLFFKVPGNDTMRSLSDSSSSNDGGILVDDDDVISLDESSVSNDTLRSQLESSEGGILIDEEDVMSLDESSHSHGAINMLDSKSYRICMQEFETYSNPSRVAMNIDLITCPSDEERSIDGVMVHVDADVSCVEESSIESWAEL